MNLVLVLSLFVSEVKNEFNIGPGNLSESARSFSVSNEGASAGSVHYEFTVTPGKGFFIREPPKAAVVPQVVLPVVPRYPVRGGWFTGPNGYMIGREAMIAHLQSGEHYGKFNPNWLNTLSNEEVQSLHSDDHQHKVKWQYVIRPKQPVQVIAPTYQQQYYDPSCPNGQCPNFQHRRLLRGFR